jgi:hypothetical protein
LKNVVGEVPLMQHPTNGKLFSVATGAFVDDDDDEEAQSSTKVSNVSRSAPQQQYVGETKSNDRSNRSSSNRSGNNNATERSMIPLPPALELPSRQPSKRYVQMKSEPIFKRDNNDDVYGAAISTLEKKMEEARVTLERTKIGQVEKCRDLVDLMTACAQSIRAMINLDK